MPHLKARGLMWLQITRPFAIAQERVICNEPPRRSLRTGHLPLSGYHLRVLRQPYVSYVLIV